MTKSEKLVAKYEAGELSRDALTCELAALGDEAFAAYVEPVVEVAPVVVSKVEIDA